MVGSALRNALARHQEGKLDEAATLYRKVLENHPGNAEALHLLGVVEYQAKNLIAALELIDRAIALKPNGALFYSNRGLALLDLGRLEEALQSFDRALVLEPRYAEAHNNRGNALKALKRFDEALASYKCAVAINSGYAEAFNNIGNALQALERYEEAVVAYGRAVTIKPDYAEAFNNRGTALQALERYDQALASYVRALAIKPDYAEALNNRGAAFRLLGRLDDALASYDRALVVRPDYPEALNNRGTALWALQRLEEALESYDRAFAIIPEFAEALNHRGQVLWALQRYEDAIVSYDHALALKRQDETQFNRSLVRLLLGQFLEGWRDYRERPSMHTVKTVLHRSPLPSDLHGSRILVLRDQGLGDEIFFLRFAPALKARGATVFYGANEKIAAIIARSGVVDHVLGSDETPADISFSISVGDLPYLLEMADGAEVPSPLALPVLPEVVERMAARLGALGPAPYIGVTWRAGTKDLKGGLFKEVPRAVLAASLADVPGTLLALQRLPHEGEVAAFAGEAGRPVHDLTALNGSLEEMLGLLALLDDYVCVSNTNVHLRAGVGRPSRVLVPSPPEFRWMAKGDESPWFPGTRVYRQSANGDWQTALASVGRDLR